MANVRLKNFIRQGWVNQKQLIQDVFSPPGYIFNGEKMSRLYESEDEEDVEQRNEKVEGHFRAERRRVKEVIFDFNPKEDMPLTSLVGKELLKKAIIEPGFRVLEYSPTIGSVALPAAQLCPWAHFDIVDDNEEIMDQYEKFCKSQNIDNVDFYMMDTTLPVRPNSYDLCLSNFGLVYSANIRRDLKDIWRVLKPSSKLIFTCWSTYEETSALNLLDAMLAEMYPDRCPIKNRGQWHESEIKGVFFDIDDYNLLGVEEVEKVIRLEKGADYWDLMMNPAREQSLKRLFTEDEREHIKNYTATFLDSQYLFDTIELHTVANLVIARKPSNILERMFFE